MDKWGRVGKYPIYEEVNDLAHNVRQETGYHTWWHNGQVLASPQLYSWREYIEVLLFHTDSQYGARPEHIAVNHKALHPCCAEYPEYPPFEGTYGKQILIGASEANYVVSGWRPSPYGNSKEGERLFVIALFPGGGSMEIDLPSLNKAQVRCADRELHGYGDSSAHGPGVGGGSTWSTSFSVWLPKTSISGILLRRLDLDDGEQRLINDIFAD